MRSQLKAAAERVAGNQIWIEPSTEPERVRALIGALRPLAIRGDLIRVGGSADGGYLLPDDLDGVVACVSPGVSTEVGFDLEMAERGVDVYMADASVGGPPVQHPRFHFTPKFLDVYEDERNIRLDRLCASIAAPGDRLLQMDIEGAEYRVLLDASDDTLRSFRIMVIEFHHLTRMYGRFPVQFIEATFRKLLRFHHVVHIHPNNVCGPMVRGGISIPPVMEFTFYRKDRAVLAPERRLEFPHPLDRDNLSRRPPISLPQCWQ